MATMVNKQRGRPAGGSDARQRILDAATERFLRDGFRRTTLRGIAAQAEVDHRLVNYHFGSKGGLFNAVMDLVASPGAIVDQVAHGGVERLGPRLLDAVVGAWDHPRPRAQIRRLLADLDRDPRVRAAFREYVETHVIGRLAELVGGRDARHRVAPVASVVVGLFVTRYVVQVEPIASMSRAEVVRYLSPAIDAGLAGLSRRPPRRPKIASHPS